MNRLVTEGLDRREFLKKAGAGTAFFIIGGFFRNCAKKGSDTLRLVQISDTHISMDGGTQNLEMVLADILENIEMPFLLVNTGDISEHGWKEELREYEKIMRPFPVEHREIMGNHDSRWSSSGRLDFEYIVGQKHFVYDSEISSIIGVDTSVLLEQYGYISSDELRWLEKQLRRRKDKPAILCMHHPPGWEGRYIGSDFPLFSVISKFKVPLVLSGHVHRFREIRINGTRIITSGSTTNRETGYLIHEISRHEIKTYLRNPHENRNELMSTIPLLQDNNSIRHDLSFQESLPDIKNGELIVSGLEYNPELLSVFLDGKRQEFSDENGRIHIQVNDIYPGNHELEIDSDKNRFWDKFEIRDGNNFKNWMTKLLSSVQSKPAFFRNSVIVASNDGKLYWLNSKTGVHQFVRQISSHELLSSPVIAGNRLFIGTLEGRFFCINAENGNILWQRKLDSSVIATSLPYHNSVAVGTGKGSLFCLTQDTGEIRYRFNAGRLIKCTPAFDGEALYFGVWDGYFYCIDAFNGKLKWKKYINSPHFSPATSNPQIFEDCVIFVSHDYRIHCLSRKDGTGIWNFPDINTDFKWNSPIVSRCKVSYSSAIFLDRTAFFTSLTGHVVGFDMDSGKQVAEIPLDEEIFDSFPVLFKSRYLVAGGIGGTLFFVDLIEKKIAAGYSTGYVFIFSPPAIRGDNIVIGNMAGEVHSINENILNHYEHKTI